VVINTSPTLDMFLDLFAVNASRLPFGTTRGFFSKRVVNGIAE